MKRAASGTFSLTVETHELTRALNHLRKSERLIEFVYLTHRSGTLTVSIGRAFRDIPATGTWPGPESVVVVRKWAEVLAANPIEAALTVLQLADGKLKARDFAVECSLAPPPEGNEEVVKRQEDLEAAFQILTRYKVTKLQVSTLMAKANPEKARLWGPNDGRLIDDVADAWRELVSHGVETSDIRRLLDRKSHDLWKSGRKSDADGYSPFARYKVTEREKRDLVDNADPAKARPWPSYDSWLIAVALAWKRLALYG